MRFETTTSDPLRRKLRRVSRAERREEASAFLRRFANETSLNAAEFESRKREIDKDLRKFGFYRHTSEELAFGARIAWRNHARCIGRLHWRSLEVFDCRHVTDPTDIMSHTLAQMDHAWNDGKIRSTISVFAPVEGDTLPPYFENRQITQYACYLGSDGKTLGDPLHYEYTRTVQSLGWQPPDQLSAFDMLPVVIREPRGNPHVFELPEPYHREVPITLDGHPDFDALGLRWHSVPFISGMIMSIGGIDYPTAPFNGYFMTTEIGSRNFCDERRYNLLDTIAGSLGLDTDATANPFWRDEAMLACNQATQTSFSQAGVKIIDHHTASDQYAQFELKEQSDGRIPSGNWSWIVPPMSGSACHVFHLGMTDLHAVPNFYHAGGIDGLKLAPSYEDYERTRLEVEYDFWKKWLRRWLRRGGDNRIINRVLDWL